jgi:hypothetical protein
MLDWAEMLLDVTRGGGTYDYSASTTITVAADLDPGGIIHSCWLDNPQGDRGRQ